MIVPWAPAGAVDGGPSTTPKLGTDIIGVGSDTTQYLLDQLATDYNTSVGAIAGVSSFFPTSTGTVEMGGQSVSQILPETSSDATTIGTQLAVSSLVNVQGQDIKMDSGVRQNDERAISSFRSARCVESSGIHFDRRQTPSPRTQSTKYFSSPFAFSATSPWMSVSKPGHSSLKARANLR